MWDLLIEEEALLFDGFDEAVIGTTYRMGTCLAVYDYHLLIYVLMNEGMEEEEAMEFIDYNMVNVWMGEKTPIIVFGGY